MERVPAAPARGSAGDRARSAQAGRSERPEPLDVRADVQSVLGGAVDRLARETGADRVAAWCRGASGRPAVFAAWNARGEDASLRALDEEAYAALAALPAATDLACEAAAHAGVAREQGFLAAAPVRTGGAEPAAFLLVGGGEAAEARGVRPRTLAALDAEATRLASPLAAAAAAERLARMDADVRRLDRLAALGSLVAEVVHEIRNPLVSVKTFLQLLPDRAQEADFRESFLAVASDELRRVERLLDVVLQHGRPAPAGRSDAACAPRPALDSVARLVSHRALERGVEVEVDATPELPDARIAPDGLRQVLLNLALNAIDVTPEGGRVRFVARAQGAAALALRVEDEGPGVPPELRERLFEPFFSTKGERPGGLGLAISRRIVAEADGALELEERRGGGCAFRLELPKA